MGKEHILELNNENNFVGSGSYGLTNELTDERCYKSVHVTIRDPRGNINSQESVGISPSMFGEFVFPYYSELAKEFGLTYHGCCEPVHDIWEKYIRKLSGSWEVSISACSNKEYAGNALRGVM